MWDSTISIDDFIGNETETSKIISWLGKIIYEGITPEQSYAIITGESGNGKTALIQALANYFKVPILYTTPADIVDKTSLMEFKQSLNLMTITGDIKHKIVLIDDIDEYNNSAKVGFLKTQLMKNVLAISDQPVIYTTRNFKDLPDYFKDPTKCVICNLRKPLFTELAKLLNKYCKEYGFKFTRQQIDEIVRQAPSVRSAIMSLFSEDISSVLENEISIFTKFKMIKERRLKSPLTSYEMKIFAFNCKELNDLLYTTKLSIKSDMRYGADVNPNLLNKEFKLPGRYEFFSVKKENFTLNEEEAKLAKAIHVSAKRFKQEFKFLHIEQQEKKKDTITRKKIEEKLTFQGLNSFY